MNWSRCRSSWRVLPLASALIVAASGRPTRSLWVQQRLTAQNTGDERNEARDLLRQGVKEYNGAQYDQAIIDLKQASELDPLLINARLYLGTVYSAKYIPGATSDDNTRYARLALEAFKGVLNQDPDDIWAIDGIGALLYRMALTPFDADRIRESKSYHERHIQLRPDDPVGYYWVAVIDWLLSYRANRALRDEYNKTTKKAIDLTDPMQPALSERFAREWRVSVDEGIADLNRAIELKPDYDDAMAYLNLLYRQKADMETSSEMRDADIWAAESLTERALTIKKRKAAQQAVPSQQP